MHASLPSTSHVAPTSIVVPAPLSFDQVYALHFRFVWRVLRTYGLSPGLIEDAMQDVFVVVHRRLPEFEGRSDIRTWLFRIARWVVTSERRKRRTNPVHEEIDEALADPGATPYDLAVRSEAVEALERVLGQMEPEKRMVFLLMDIEEMKAGEVAGLLEINVNTVYSRLRLARQQFRELLGGAR